MPSKPSKVALVTGATSGIGNATAAGLAKAGFHVVLLVRDNKRGQATAEALRKQVPGATVEVLVGDLASQAAVRKAAAQFLDQYATLDVLVNCAGVFVGSSRVDLQACKLEYSIVSPK